MFGKALLVALFSLTIWCVLVASASTRQPGCSAEASWPAARLPLAQQVFQLVNEHRRMIGLTALRTTRKLRRLAIWKSREMAATHLFSHDDPSRSIWDRFRACGVTNDWRGENIAYGYPDARSVVQGWLNSPGHRANIENPHFHFTGVAAAGVSPPYYTQDFGS